MTPESTGPVMEGDRSWRKNRARTLMELKKDSGSLNIGTEMPNCAKDIPGPSRQSATQQRSLELMAGPGRTGQGPPCSELLSCGGDNPGTFSDWVLGSDVSALMSLSLLVPLTLGALPAPWLN